MTDSAPPAESVRGERHASWLELFFDLTAVAGVAQLAHLLHGGPDPAELGLYTVMFLAFWTGWMMFTVYGNISGDEARVRTVLVGMFGLAVMAASVHGVREERAGAFALAYILVRSLAGKAWGRRGPYVAELPLSWVGVGLTPWVVSMWCEGTTRYALWALGLALDLVVMFTVSTPAPAGRGAAGGPPPPLPGGGRPGGGPGPVAARTDAPHLGERLGLFVLIVLGEGVAQVVAAASGVADWDWALYGVGTGAFVLLLQLWSLSLRHGADGVPLLAAGALPLRVALPLHCFVAGAVAALAAALGDAVAATEGAVPAAVRGLMCGSLGAYLLIAGVAAVCSGRGAGRALLLVGPPVALVVALGAAGRGWGPVELVWMLALAARWPLLAERFRWFLAKQ